jgi:uncharacterized repeat protein (TIGR04076 family)
MYELKVSVIKVLGACTAQPPMKPGDSFYVSDGDIRVPEGGYICMWALQSLLPVITPKEREILEERVRIGCGACSMPSAPTRMAG